MDLKGNGRVQKVMSLPSNPQLDRSDGFPRCRDIELSHHTGSY